MDFVPNEEICNARIGIMGNPSDGFQGKTISLLIENFHATVCVIPHEKVIIKTGENDPGEYSDLSSLFTRISVEVSLKN